MSAADMGILGERQAATASAPGRIGGADRGDQNVRSEHSAPVVLAMGAAAAAASVGISRRKLELLADRGEIPRVRLDGRVVYRVADLADLLERHLETTTKKAAAPGVGSTAAGRSTTDGTTRMEA